MHLNFGDENGQLEFSSESIKDLNSGELIEIHSPEMFDLETVLLDSAYYTFQGREYRFLLCHARKLGLKTR